MQIEIQWVQPDITVTAELDNRNPQLVDLLWNRFLPYHSLQNHALVSGDHLYHLVPHPELIYTPAQYTEDRTTSPDGTVFLSQLQHLAVKYGPLTEYLPAAPVGHVVPEHLGLLREAGRFCWQAAYSTKEVVEVRVRRKGAPETTDYALPLPPQIDSPAVQKIVDEIHDETQRIWISPPSEITDLHQGRTGSRAGSRNQYFSTLVFLNGEVRPLGYCSLNGLVRLTRATDLPLDTLRLITPAFIKVPAEFLGYCGLDTLWRFTQQTIQAMETLSTREQYFALVNSLALYVNTLNTWNLHYFPWHHGSAYPYPAPDPRSRPEARTAP
jgi:hypothetical protein